MRGVALVALLATATVGGLLTFREKLGPLRGSQEWRSPVRATLAKEGIDHGILRARDNLGIYAATDLFVDPPSLFLVNDDRAGNVELRRAHAELPGLVERVDVMRWGHAMVRPRVGQRAALARGAAATPRGPIHFAHTDLSGLALFEEAHDHGVRAAEEALSAVGIVTPSLR